MASPHSRCQCLCESRPDAGVRRRNRRGRRQGPPIWGRRPVVRRGTQGRNRQRAGCGAQVRRAEPSRWASGKANVMDVGDGGGGNRRRGSPPLVSVRDRMIQSYGRHHEDADLKRSLILRSGLLVRVSKDEWRGGSWFRDARKSAPPHHEGAEEYCNDRCRNPRYRPRRDLDHRWWCRPPLMIVGPHRRRGWCR